MKCFYHSADLDGHCSGALVKLEHPECEMIGINYGDPFPWDTIGSDEVVFMVDFSLQPFSDMLRLNSACGVLYWIDHHKTALDAMIESGVRFNGLQRDGMGACALVWEFLFGSAPTRMDMYPHFVDLLARYDVWEHSHPDCLAFQYGMRMQNTLPGEYVWHCLASGSGAENGRYLLEIVDRGRVVLNYEAQQNEKYAKATAFETELRGLRCIAMNRLLCNSKAFDAVVDPEKHDAMLAFGWRKGEWKFSLYAVRDDVDVSAVAKHYGGGGHRGAAGFQCAYIPFFVGAEG